MTCALKFRLLLHWWLSFVAFARAVSCGAAPAYDKVQGVIQGTALDAVTRQPIARVKVSSDSTHYTYTAADGTYTLNTSVSADTARRDPPTLEEKVRSLIAELVAHRSRVGQQLAPGEIYRLLSFRRHSARGQCD